MYRWKPWNMLIIAILIFSITACVTKKQGTGTTGNTNYNITSNERNTEGNTNFESKNQYSTSGITNRGPGITPSAMHNNTRMGLNQYIADAVNSLPEVQSSRAMVTDSNVYVAVKLKDNVLADNASSNNMAANKSTNMNMGTTDAGQVKKITSGITGNSFDLQSPQPTASGDMPKQIKEKIDEKVRSVSDPTLQHVYISLNPDFFQRMENYAADVKQGNLLSGAVREFNIMVQRIFPTTADTGAYGGSTSSSVPSTIIGNSNGPMGGKSGGAKEK